jgi:acetyl/propionyl-CoA carboxylase alpha subunit
MKLEIELGGVAHSVEFSRIERKVLCVIDGTDVEADAVEIAPGFYSILIGGRSLDARVEPFGGELRIRVGSNEYNARVRDPRKWERNHRGPAASEARQHVAAPMPGRVVRVLVRVGDAVSVGQGLVVVEAMKMQNEVRSPKAGVVERLLVTEGQALNAGDAIAVIA